MPFCTKCGAQLPDNAHFCGSCGAQLAAPAEQPYPQPAPAYGNQYQQPRQPAYGQYQQPRQQAYADYGWNEPAREKKPANRNLLIVFSILLALGIIVAAIGFGTQLYLNRTYDTLVKDSIEQTRKVYQEELEYYKERGYEDAVEYYQNQIDQLDTVNKEMYQKYAGDIKSLLSAFIVEDPAQLKKAAKSTAIHIIKTAPDFYKAYLATSGRSAGSDNPLSAIPEFYADNRSEVDSIMDDLLKGIENSSLRVLMKKVGKLGSEEFGFRWFILRLSGRSTLLMIVGGALALLSLILWFVFGGPSAGAGQSGLTAALVVSLILAVAIIALCLFILEPIPLDTVKEIVEEESRNNYTEWNNAAEGIVKNATTVWNDNQERIMKLLNRISIPGLNF